MFQVTPTWLAILINAEINNQLFLLNKTYVQLYKTVC